MNKKIIYISSLVACIVLFYVEQALVVNYLIKTLVKIFLFTLIPYLYIRFIDKKSIKESINLNRLDISNIRLGLVFGIASFAIVLISYALFKDFLDINSIINELQAKSQITPGNFFLVGLYIILGNSFLEEFFFRGFIFLNLYKLDNKLYAYIYSSALFAVYHVGIFKTWFNIWLIGLALLGLIVIGLIFNWLNTKSNNFLNSWLVHIFADIAIIIIGFRMFGII
ncbi:CPBP family intramembrane glutamic endopeptidase [Serpentinicella alkaliphila]|uniref:CAAX prenyl protease-like protein n=1 Tax=Serpentinicella alkaliphila TaxID=1734049 RepID=A0A4V2T1Z4_9FIRM|nr:CPBP family intramembrane glutamic endopeptidase [Serpentinicella alkaliphila]QUH26509.1 CPBP family intramembrane metalloprotease [Serpentinicella alkaliphila]TCP95493.1 CAAX prenyl protease-like protein [Serpentinicella alkaliphila]